MEQGIYWFFDIFTVGILLIFLYIGAKRGFLKSVVYTVLILASFFISWFAAEASAPFIYDSFIKERVISGFEENTSGSDPAKIVSQAVSEGGYGVEMTENDITGLIGSASDFFADLAKEMRQNGSSDSEEAIKSGVEKSVEPKVMDILFSSGSVVSSSYVKNALETVGGAAEKIGNVVNVFIMGSREEAAKAAESHLIAPIVKWLLKVVIFLIVIFILRLVVVPVSNIFKFVNKVPIIGPLNVILGGILGALEGLLFLYAVSLAVKAVINVSGNSLIFFNTQTVEMTRLFIKFYNFDFLSLFA